MCHPSCIEFGKSHISREEIKDKRVLEVGSLDINGSLRSFICSYEPLYYLGVDVFSGPGVDEICDINNLTKRYGPASFDVVICTEVMEHVRDWRKAISNLKNVLKPKGIMILTTRSKGFAHHSFPSDFWRYEMKDMQVIFGDMVIEANEKDSDIPGVFVKIHKPCSFNEKDLSALKLYSIVKLKRCIDVNEFDIFVFKIIITLRQLLSRTLPENFKSVFRKIIFSRQR
ncbi:hypothetical protein SMITH_266 [Smithella sp. ME-1]|uniref:Methyltransferase type 11 n=1 Tax=hydrocarbon metagenome TaxID=938273 RepID=A0A0W8FMA5_9ZZZZ|nr:hypothetical protein SMITH_266 [Smithella sp. ME-1]